MNAATEPPGGFVWPPLICLAALALAATLDAVYQLPWITGPLADILFAVGWLSIAAAFTLGGMAVRALAKAKTTVLPTRISEHLVTTGPFGLTRNPIYLAYAIFLIGLGLILGSVWFLVAAILASFLTRKLAIDGEERHLDARFGKRYRDYAKRVRRWL